MHCFCTEDGTNQYSDIGEKGNLSKFVTHTKESMAVDELIY